MQQQQRKLDPWAPSTVAFLAEAEMQSTHYSALGRLQLECLCPVLVLTIQEQCGQTGDSSEDDQTTGEPAL